MSAYVLRDPRTGAARYVGHSHNPAIRARQIASRPHSAALRAWLADMATAGVALVLETLGPGSEAEWIERLRPDLNINEGESTAHPSWGNPIMIRIPRGVLEEAKDHAKADDRTVNSYIIKAVRAMNARGKKEGVS